MRYLFLFFLFLAVACTSGTETQLTPSESHELDVECQDSFSSFDFTGALKVCRKAADNGIARSQHNLGLMYYDGLGVPKDYAEAKFWFLKGAERGYTASQIYLATMYSQGLGGVFSKPRAYFWLTIADRLGNDDALSMRNRIVPYLDNEAQLRTVEQHIEEWLKVYPKTE